jgi:hypothetical protein
MSLMLVNDFPIFIGLLQDLLMKVDIMKTFPIIWLSNLSTLM